MFEGQSLLLLQLKRVEGLLAKLTLQCDRHRLARIYHPTRQRPFATVPPFDCHKLEDFLAVSNNFHPSVGVHLPSRHDRVGCVVGPEAAELPTATDPSASTWIQRKTCFGIEFVHALITGAINLTSFVKLVVGKVWPILRYISPHGLAENTRVCEVGWSIFRELGGPRVHVVRNLEALNRWLHIGIAIWLRHCVNVRLEPRVVQVVRRFNPSLGVRPPKVFVNILHLVNLDESSIGRLLHTDSCRRRRRRYQGLFINFPAIFTGSWLRLVGRGRLGCSNGGHWLNSFGHQGRSIHRSSWCSFGWQYRTDRLDPFVPLARVVRLELVLAVYRLNKKCILSAALGLSAGTAHAGDKADRDGALESSVGLAVVGDESLRQHKPTFLPVLPRTSQFGEVSRLDDDGPFAIDRSHCGTPVFSAQL
mmetsp:Transcript_25294/g.66146  ORF Transcript_25294/g.66146 Transcript_25294/m.66146 type:complete len:420 (-) Transcript_25294:58-1317(-)